MKLADKIVALALLGKRRGEIAKEAGCSINVVYYHIYQARLRGVAIPSFKKGSPKWAPLMVRQSAAKKLRRAAKARNVTPAELAETILNTMVKDQLIAAVLDDGVADV